jgi:hypothetical protein
MEKKILAVSYWLGIACAALALLSRVLIAFNVMPFRFGAPGGVVISYLAFFHGAALFLLIAIASWCKASKS